MKQTRNKEEQSFEGGVRGPGRVGPSSPQKAALIGQLSATKTIRQPQLSMHLLKSFSFVQVLWRELELFSSPKQINKLKKTKHIFAL